MQMRVIQCMGRLSVLAGTGQKDFETDKSAFKRYMPKPVRRDRKT